MREIVLRLIITGIAIAITAALLPGIHVQDNSLSTYAILAIIVGLVNAILKPIIVVLSCPLVIMTLGLFMLAINGILLLIADAIAGARFTIDGFWWAVLGGLIMGILNSALEGAFGLDDDDKEEVVVIRS